MRPRIAGKKKTPRLAKTAGTWGIGFEALSLENDLAAELQAAAGDAVGRIVAGESITTVWVELIAAELSHSQKRRSGVVYILNRDTKPLMVQDVEGLGLKLERQVLGDFDVLKHSQIHGTDGLAAFGVAAERRERRAKELFCIDVVDDEVSLAHCDR